VSPFAGRSAFVTGAASGIGRAVAEALARAGAVVSISDVDEVGVLAVAKDVAAAGGQVHAERLDVADGEAVRTAIDAAAARAGRLDLVFNNAGISVAGETLAMTDAHWQRIVDVNLWGVIHGVRAALPVMARQGSGHIVNTASLAGLLPSPLNVAYAATKYAVVGLSQSLRMEAAGRGVNVSVVCPGLVATGILRNAVQLDTAGVDVSARVGLRPYPVEKAARAILRGVARNDAVIVFPAHAHAARWLWRLAPWFIERRVAREMAEYRREWGRSDPAQRAGAKSPFK
jgi:NAD(P)-dependent dehydrogenase (short-subunit alcohol dehydrogenase family)